MYTSYSIIMDFDRTSLEWTDHDFSGFRYGHKGESIVVTKFLGEEDSQCEPQTFTKKDEWKDWLQNASFLRQDEKRSTPGLCVVLIARRDTSFDRLWERMQAPVQHLPFGQDIFVQLVKLFRIHPRITRTIGRESCYFSLQHHDGVDGDGSIISCTARTTSQLPDDLAFSSAFIPHLNLSLAVVYGCNQKQKREAIRRIRACDLAQTHHPLLLAGMFFEMERVRLGDAVDKLLDNFALRGSSSDRDLDLDMNKARMTEFLKSCYESRELVNHIKAVQLELEKLISAVSSGNLLFTQPSSLNVPQPDNKRDDGNDGKSDTAVDLSLIQASQISSTTVSNPELASASRRILTRLHDISRELTTKSHDCTLVNSNMSLTMTTAMSHFARLDNQTNLRLSRVNTELARTNTGLSQDMKRDSSQMRSIALLTMVFLPMTTVASIFSTGFFTWDANIAAGEQVVSSWIWVLAVISVGLTLLVVGIWWWVNRGERAARTEKETSADLSPRVKTGNRKMGRFRRSMGRVAHRVKRKVDLRGKGKPRGRAMAERNQGANAMGRRAEMDVDLERGIVGAALDGENGSLKEQ